MKSLANLHQSTWKSQNRDLDDILFPRNENVWDENLQRSYVSWKWRMMQNLKWNWLVSSKETWGIWWILTWALKSFKNLNYYGLRLTKVYVWAEKVERSYVWWYWILMQNLMENWLVLSKMTWGFLQIFTRAH